MSGGLREAQLAMASYLRNPETVAAPEGIEQRRLAIYSGLIYSNIEGFISGGFPVLRSLYDEDDWHALVRVFIDGHRCKTPYFLEISQEFVHFLMNEHSLRDCDPPFIAELAHYEWVELALDVSEETPPTPAEGIDPLLAVPRLSPLAWSLNYHYPVHLIGPGFRPAEQQPCYLLVYRNREDKVCFMVLNPASARLVELLSGNENHSGAELLQRLAQELQLELDAVLNFGGDQLREFASLSIIGLAEP